jgi:DnaJ-class molecular chaperone
MKKMIAVVALTLCYAVSAMAADTVVMKAKNGDVTFNHKAHSTSMECAVCHGEGTPAKLALGKDKAHALCKDCHTKKGAGPTKCGDCHKK